MPLTRIVPSFAEAVADIHDGATVMLGGFGGTGGAPLGLVRALRDRSSRDLTIISNTAGIASTGFGTVSGARREDLGMLVESSQVKKVVASFPVSGSPSRQTPSSWPTGRARLKWSWCPRARWRSG